MLKTAIALAILITVPAGVRAQDHDRDDYTAPRNATVDAQGAARIRVEAGAGSLKIVGRSGISEVRVHGTARASRREWLDDIKLKAERHGDEVSIVVDIPNDDRGWGDGERALDLDIEVPNRVALDVEDGSGDAERRGV